MVTETVYRTPLSSSPLGRDKINEKNHSNKHTFSLYKNVSAIYNCYWLFVNIV